MRLVDAAPGFAAELANALAEEGEPELGVAFTESAVTRFTHRDDERACYIHLESALPLNAVEQNLIGVRHGRTICTRHPYWVNVDVDNFGRPRGVELLDAPAEFARELRSTLAE